MTDVAKAADVSIMTVSRVLNGSSQVTEEKRQAVFAVVERLRYQRNELALALGDFPLHSDREFALFRGTVRGERRTTGLHYGLKLHQLDASPVGVVEVRLPFAVLAQIGRASCRERV